MAKCYKMPIPAFIRAPIEPILQAPNGLQNPRETKAFAIGYEAGKWSITSVQIGNNCAHTLRDSSQLYHSDLKPENGENWTWQLLNQIRLANRIR
jgi:hypothetical protein